MMLGGGGWGVGQESFDSRIMYCMKISVQLIYNVAKKNFPFIELVDVVYKRGREKIIILKHITRLESKCSA